MMGGVCVCGDIEIEVLPSVPLSVDAASAGKMWTVSSAFANWNH